MRQEMLGFWDAVASAGPYANNVHTLLQIDNRLITQFFSGRMLYLTPNQHSSRDLNKLRFFHGFISKFSKTPFIFILAEFDCFGILIFMPSPPWFHVSAVDECVS